ncbi:MAG TPA: hypothetical protein VF715_08215 [Thermoleophilaceae bacterium]
MSRVGRIRSAGLLAAVVGTLFLSGCGDDDEFANEPRPPIPIQLSGVITDSSISVDPSKLGAGPIVLLVANETDTAHSVTLEGPSGREEVGPINPQDTGRIQHELQQGSYEVRAGSDEAVEQEIAPAKLSVGPKRPSSSGDVLLP